jgi:ribonuclease Z
MTFSFTVLGSSAAIAVRERHLSAHLLNVDERFFLIDCGEGTQFQLRKYHISLRRIHYILISHLHGDHFFGLIGLLNTMHLLGRKEVLEIFGPAMLEEIITIQLQASMTSLNYPVVFRVLTEDNHLLMENERVTVKSFPVRHRIPAFGFVFREKNPPRKVSSPRSFAYCGDTAYFEEIIPWVSGVSLLYHEATFMQDLLHAAEAKFHSTAMQAATIAKKAQVQRLLLGHFSARYDDLLPLLNEAMMVFPESMLAVEGEQNHL